jgi:hypothetical protein
MNRRIPKTAAKAENEGSTGNGLGMLTKMFTNFFSGGEAMKKKDCVIGFRPTEKNRFYLERLGFLDGRTGKTTGRDMADYLNRCVTMVCESCMDPSHSVASNDELRAAWIKYNVAVRNRRIDALQKELEIMQRQRIVSEVEE